MMMGGVAVAVLLFYGFAWEPLRRDYTRLRESLPHARSQAADFGQKAAEAKRLQGLVQNARRGANPRASVEASAEQLGLKREIKQIVEVPGGRLQLELDPVPYDKLIRWIGVLATTAAIGVESLELRLGPSPGTVLVETLVLRGYGTS